MVSGERYVGAMAGGKTPAIFFGVSEIKKAGLNIETCFSGY
jgi:hypothetical protein